MLRLQDLAKLASRYASHLDLPVQEFTLGTGTFRFGSQPAIMGVINLSRDSWYRESVAPNTEAAIRRGIVLAAQGAHVVDVGAESTLLNAARHDEANQVRQLLPVVRDLASRGIPVSVETYEPGVSRACLEAGAAIINLTGTDGAEDHMRLAAEHGAGLILCYVSGSNVRDVEEFDLEGDVVGRLYEFFARQVERATRCGVTRIFIDPGLGFYYRNLQDGALRVRHQMNIFLNTFRLRALGWPVCHALPHAFEYFGEEVRSAEPFFAALAAVGGTDLFRTHEVPRIKAVLDTLKAF